MRFSISKIISLLALGFGFAYVQAYAQTPQEKVDTYVQEVKDRVYVIGFWGRDGGGGGIQSNIESIENELIPLGISGDHVYVRGWVNFFDDVPGQYPAIYAHFTEFKNKLGTKSPSYLALTGHSFGGWAASWFSLAMNRNQAFMENVFFPHLAPSYVDRNDMSNFPPQYKVDYVALMDPVWYRGVTGPYMKQVNSKDGISYYQDHSILDEDACYPQSTFCEATDPESCGHIVDDILNQKEVFKKDENGGRERKDCAIGSRPHQKESHVSIDDSPWLKRLVRERIVSDVKGVINKATADAIKIYAHDPILNYWKIVWENVQIDSPLLNEYTAKYLGGTLSIDQIHADIRRRAVESAFSDAQAWDGFLFYSNEVRDAGDRLLLKGSTRNDLFARFTATKIHFEVKGGILMPDQVGDDVVILRPDALALVPPRTGYKKMTTISKIDETYLEVLGRNAEAAEVDSEMSLLESKHPGFLATTDLIMGEWEPIKADINFRMVVIPTIVISALLQ